MTKLGISVFLLIAGAVCIFSAGCIGTDTSATPTPTATPTATVVPTQGPTKLPENMTPVTTITVEKYGVAIPAGNMIRYIVPSNPTTGYQWTAVPGLSAVKSDNLVILNATYVPTPVAEGIVGSGGTYE